MKKILIAGGTGLVGSYLIKGLIDKGYEPLVLTRSPKIQRDYKTFAWDPATGYIDKDAFDGVKIIVNLSGANIGEGRWTKARKIEIIESRIKSTQLLFKTAKELNIKADKYISASATGFYGAVSVDHIFTEEDAAADDFVGQVCARWEDEADSFSDLGSDLVKLRLGIVLDSNDGALKRMVAPANLYMGTALGTGKQYIPWIHPLDLTGIFLKAIDDTKMKGSYNVVSPSFVTNKEFMRTLTSVLGKPFIGLNAPSLIIKLLFGEMSDLILEGSRVSSKKIMDAGYKFLYPDLEDALINIIKP